MRFIFTSSAAVAAHALLASTVLAGPEWVELSDAGPLPQRSQDTSGSGPLGSIRGDLRPSTPLVGGESDDQDMFVIWIDDPANFRATTVFDGGYAEFDSRLWLFDLDGFGLLANDDSFDPDIGIDGFFWDGSTLDPTANDGTGSTIIGAPGLYLLAISTNATLPTNNNGPIFSFFDGSTEVSGPDGAGGAFPITDWAIDEGGDDDIIITVAGAPSDALEYRIVLRGVTLAARVAIDVKPGANPNVFNRSSNGVLSVVIAGMDAAPEGYSPLDVHEIDLSTIRMSLADGVQPGASPNDGPPGPPFQFANRITPIINDPEVHCADSSNQNDGLIDLVVKFRSDEVSAHLALHEFNVGDTVLVKVSGYLKVDPNSPDEAPQPFVGYDCLKIVGPPAPPGQLKVTSSIPGLWINSDQLDVLSDSGGFGSFIRTYPQKTLVNFTAPSVFGYEFQGWSIGGSKSLIRTPKLPHTVNKPSESIHAIYRPL